MQRQLSRALRKGGNVEAALDTLEKLLDEDPDYLPGLVDYAWLLEKVSDFVYARYSMLVNLFIAFVPDLDFRSFVQRFIHV